MWVDGYLGHRFAQPQAVLSVPGGDARVGRGRAGWEGTRGSGGDARVGRTKAQEDKSTDHLGGVSELGIRRNESVPKGDREDSPGLREPVRPMPRVNEINQSGALKGRESCPEADGPGQNDRLFVVGPRNGADLNRSVAKGD